MTDWSEETVQMCARRQAEILHSGAALVRPGGRLVYSTCTLNPAENRLIVEEFLKNNPEFSLCPFTVAGKETDGILEILPFTYETDGFFISKMKKNV